MATIALTGTFWKAPGDVAWASAPYTIRLVRPFAILGEAAHPRWSRSGTASAEGAISETLTVPDEGTAHFELVAPDGNIYTAHLAADDTPTVEAWMAAAYTTPTDIATTQSLIDAALATQTLGEHADVTVALAEDGDALVFDADTAMWIPGAAQSVPGPHAPTHAVGGDDPLALDISQIGAAGWGDLTIPHWFNGYGFYEVPSSTYATEVSVNAAKNRATHTGTQAISTVSGLQGALDGKAASSHTHPAADVWADVSISFTANGSAYFVAPRAMTFASAQAGGSGTLDYAKALAADTTAFSATSLPVTLATGDVLRVTVSTITTYKSVTLVRSA